MSEKVIIIAEAGVNHNGNIETAKRLIDAAAEAGVDYVKFQSFKAEEIVSKNADQADLKIAPTDIAETPFQLLQRLELSEADHYALQDYCNSRNVQFLSSPFDLQSIDLLQKLGITIGKIPSGEITNLRYLRKMAQTFPKLIFSTGMAMMEEIEATIGVLLKSGAKKENITVLHCTAEYPTPMADVHLRAMNTIREQFGIAVGYSDHTLGIEVPIAAVAMGASVIKKRLTLDQHADGLYHRASLEPAELKAMVMAIRNIEQAMGGSQIRITASEIRYKDLARKSLVARGAIRKGQIFTDDNIAIKRPGNGISPMRIEEVLGRVATKDFEPDQLIAF